jgi:hypothetical protein
MIKTELLQNSINNNIINNKLLNTSEINKTIHILHKTKSAKKFNFNNENNSIINMSNEEEQKLLLNEFKMLLNVFNKINKNKNEEITINESDIPELKKSGVLGHILCENYEIKHKNEELELKIDNISKELEQIKNDKKYIRKEIENKDKIIKDMNSKINIFNQEFIKLQNIINTDNKNKNYGKEDTFSNKSSLNDLENISLGNNFNIDKDTYIAAVNKNNKKMTKNKSEKNIKSKNEFDNLNFSSKVGNYNFNDEFLKDYENFSESWRKEADKMMQRRGYNKKSIFLNNDNNKK